MNGCASSRAAPLHRPQACPFPIARSRRSAASAHQQQQHSPRTPVPQTGKEESIATRCSHSVRVRHHSRLSSSSARVPGPSASAAAAATTTRPPPLVLAPADPLALPSLNRPPPTRAHPSAVSAGLWFLSSSSGCNGSRRAPVFQLRCYTFCASCPPARAPLSLSISVSHSLSITRPQLHHPPRATSAMGIRFEGRSRHRAQRSLGELPRSSSVPRSHTRSGSPPHSHKHQSPSAHQKSNRSVNRLHHGCVS